MHPAFSWLISPGAIFGVLIFVVQNDQTLNVMSGGTKHVNSDNILIVSVSWGKQHCLLWNRTLSEPKCFSGFSFVCLLHCSTLYWQNKVKVWLLFYLYLSLPVRLLQVRDIYGKVRPQDHPEEGLSSTADLQHYSLVCRHVTSEKTPGACKQPAESSGRLLSFQLVAGGMPAACLFVSEWSG